MLAEPSKTKTGRADADAERLEIEKRQQGTVALQEKQKELGRIHSPVDFKRFRIRFWLYFIKFSLIHSFPV